MEENIKDSTIESTNPYQGESVREDLAALLSRLASLQGVAVPGHRFVYQQEAESGVALEDMAVADQAIAIWGARFPEGPTTKLKLEKLVKSDYPMLWVSSSGEELRLLRGKQNGEYISESSDWSFILRAGTTTELAKERIERHLFRFWKLVEMIKNQSYINLKFLEDIEEEDNVFPNINIDDWRI